MIWSTGPGAGRGDRRSELLGLDASLESCKLLEVLGRAEEARAALLWLTETAPSYWPGLAAARRALAALPAEVPAGGPAAAGAGSRAPGALRR